MELLPLYMDKQEKNFDFGMLHSGVAYNIIIITTKEAIFTSTLYCAHNANESLYCSVLGTTVRLERKKKHHYSSTHFPKKIKNT